MRTLTEMEIATVAGGTGQCSPNDYYGVTDTASFGDDLINIYEGAVRVTSHIIERVAESF